MEGKKGRERKDVTPVWCQITEPTGTGSSKRAIEARGILPGNFGDATPSKTRAPLILPHAI